MGRIKDRTVGYRHRLDRMDDFLEYRARQEVGRIRGKVVGEKHEALVRRGAPAAWSRFMGKGGKGPL